MDIIGSRSTLWKLAWAACGVAALAATTTAAGFGVADSRAFETAVRRYVQREEARSKGVFVLHDDALGKDWRLRLVAVRTGRMRRLSDGDYSVCADLREVGGKRRLDVDFVVGKTDSGWVARRAVLHSIDGLARGLGASLAPAAQGAPAALSFGTAPCGSSVPACTAE